MKGLSEIARPRTAGLPQTRVMLRSPCGAGGKRATGKKNRWKARLSRQARSVIRLRIVFARANWAARRQSVSRKLRRPARLSPKTPGTPPAFPHGYRGITMQTRRIYQVQHWPNGQWDRDHNWRKVEAGSEKEAAEKVCGFALTATGRLAQLRARVLRLGDVRQRSATDFFTVE